MLRAVSSIYIESQAFELLSTYRRDVFKLFRTTYTAPLPNQTVLKSDGSSAESTHRAADATPGAAPPPPPPPPPSPPPRRAWTVAAAALAVTASIGGVYFYSRLSDDEKEPPSEQAAPAPARAEPPPSPASAAELPKHVQYLLVGGGTASFAAMRAIRSARPDAQVLIVGEESALPYMRPPLSKELWREPEPAAAARQVEELTFRQWNGKRRPLVYEPEAFYAPVAALAAGGGGAAVARGWRVTRVDAAKHEAEMRAVGAAGAAGERAVVGFDKCLVAVGLRARRAEALRGARASGRALAVRGAGDAARVAEALEEPGLERVAVVGGGFLASELSAALAERLRGRGVEVAQVFREAAPMAGVLPGYLASEAARRLRLAGVRLLPEATVTASDGAPQGVVLRLREPSAGLRDLSAGLVLECVGGEPDAALAAASGLETHPELGGLLVNAELQARTDVYAAGDAACFYDVALGRRRVEHHDHAVVSGRLAGENMAAVAPPRAYTHQSMFWSDLGPDLGYEAIGIVDSRLPTVGVFSADAVSDAEAPLALEAGAVAPAAVDAPAGDAAAAGVARRYERGVVFYLREQRVVGVLLWNLFNRMHVARQVLAQGEFEDLFEVAKLFALHDDD